MFTQVGIKIPELHLHEFFQNIESWERMTKISSIVWTAQKHSLPNLINLQLHAILPLLWTTVETSISQMQTLTTKITRKIKRWELYKHPRELGLRKGTHKKHPNEEVQLLSLHFKGKMGKLEKKKKEIKEGKTPTRDKNYVTRTEFGLVGYEYLHFQDCTHNHVRWCDQYRFLQGNEKLGVPQDKNLSK